MRPRLYTPETMEFNTNGIGVLADAISCKTHLAFGGEELEMQYPITGLHYSNIQLRCILVAKPDPFRDPQPYRIYKITRPMSGVVTVYARHIVYDLSGVVTNPFTATGVAEALQGFKDNAVTDCPFTFWTDKTTSASFSVAVPSAIWSRLGGVEGSILDVFGGEYQFDGYTVKLWNRLGVDRGVSIRYGKNLTSLEQDANCANCYTGVVPFWVDGQTGTVTKLAENVIMAAGNYGYTRLLPLDLSAEFETQPTEEQLRDRATRYMTDNKIGEPEISWTVEFVQLEQTVEYKGMALLERVSLGDTVHVEFPLMGVSATARAVAGVYDCLLERYDSVTLGSVRQNIADTIAEQQKKVEQIPTVTDMQRVASALTQSILGAKGGSLRLLDTDGDGRADTLYIADNEDPALARKVWRFNYEGWGASSNGYNGPFEIGATLEDGIIANFITTGTLSAVLITAGILQAANGNFRFNMETGEIYIGGYATENDVNNLSADIAANGSDIAEMKDSLTNIKLAADGLNILVQSIIENGVDKVKTTMGYTFNDDGMRIKKSGEEIENRLDHTGMYVSRSDENVLTANADGVNAINITVRQYLSVGHSRFERFTRGSDTKRTACFWVGEVE